MSLKYLLVFINCLSVDALGTQDLPNEGELTHLKGNLKRIASAFRGGVSTNEATALHFISPLLVDAVAKVRLEHPSVMLTAEEDFGGSRGFGRVDYVVYCRGLPVLVTEAKSIEIQKGIAQNIVQLHTASEVPGLLILF